MATNGNNFISEDIANDLVAQERQRRVRELLELEQTLGRSLTSEDITKFKQNLPTREEFLKQESERMGQQAVPQVRELMGRETSAEKPDKGIGGAVKKALIGEDFGFRAGAVQGFGGIAALAADAPFTIGQFADQAIEAAVAPIGAAVRSATGRPTSIKEVREGLAADRRKRARQGLGKLITDPSGRVDVKQQIEKRLQDVTGFKGLESIATEEGINIPGAAGLGLGTLAGGAALSLIPGMGPAAAARVEGGIIQGLARLGASEAAKKAALTRIGAIGATNAVLGSPLTLSASRRPDGSIDVEDLGIGLAADAVLGAGLAGAGMLAVKGGARAAEATGNLIKALKRKTAQVAESLGQTKMARDLEQSIRAQEFETVKLQEQLDAEQIQRAIQEEAQVRLEQEAQPELRVVDGVEPEAPRVIEEPEVRVSPEVEAQAKKINGERIKIDDFAEGKVPERVKRIDEQIEELRAREQDIIGQPESEIRTQALKDLETRITDLADEVVVARKDIEQKFVRKKADTFLRDETKPGQLIDIGEEGVGRLKAINGDSVTVETAAGVREVPKDILPTKALPEKPVIAETTEAVDATIRRNPEIEKLKEVSSKAIKQIEVETAPGVKAVPEDFGNVNLEAALPETQKVLQDIDSLIETNRIPKSEGVKLKQEVVRSEKTIADRIPTRTLRVDKARRAFESDVLVNKMAKIEDTVDDFAQLKKNKEYQSLKKKLSDLGKEEEQFSKLFSDKLQKAEAKRIDAQDAKINHESLQKSVSKQVAGPDGRMASRKQTFETDPDLMKVRCK